MADVDEIIDYIKSLKKGFDKQLFESKIAELGDVASSTGLNPDDFHKLFKIWLNLSIPITKWNSLGSCIVPQESVGQNTVEYSLRWLLANHINHNNFPRIGFLLDWLTAAMESDSIDRKALDMGYEIYCILLTYEPLTIHAMKLVYNLTKPSDVTRKRVLGLLDYARNREGKKNLLRQLQVLLGLFKSYKPECVPEDVPYISIHTAFRKINANMLSRFQNCQKRRNSRNSDIQRLLWVNPSNMGMTRNKKADPLVPNMEFINIGSKQYSDKIPQKNYLDFSDSASLLQYSLNHHMSRPARLRALLCHATGHALLALAHDRHAFLSHDLHHALHNCFLDVSPHSYSEKRDLLQQLATFQSTLMQGLPVVTRFLAQYLPYWNERDYFGEILQLIEWVSFESVEPVADILDVLTKVYCRSHPIQQCAVLRSITTMYTNMVFASTRRRHYFLSIQPSEESFTVILQLISSKINGICSKGLQINPEDMRVMLSSVSSLQRSVRNESLTCGLVVSSPALLTLALPLLSTSAAAVDMLADLLLMYKQIFSTIKAKYGRKDDRYVEQMQILKAYTSDFVSCFYEEFLTNRSKGIVFSNLKPNITNKLGYLIPDVDCKMSFRNHVAFAPYTYMMNLNTIDKLDCENKMIFDTVIDEEFVYLSEFVKMAMPGLR